MVSRLKRLPATAGLRFADETVWRLFPFLRRAWARRGAQAKANLLPM
jgi:hypothetical protein